MRRDRAGDLVDDATADTGAVWMRCTGGWLDRDADRPRPCPVCRPWLAEHPPRPATRDELARPPRCSGLVDVTRPPRGRTHP